MKRTLTPAPTLTLPRPISERLLATASNQAASLSHSFFCCPRNRFIGTPDGEGGLNYLCAGYKAFFTHIDRPMKTMAELIRQGRYADEIMQVPDAAA